MEAHSTDIMPHCEVTAFSGTSSTKLEICENFWFYSNFHDTADYRVDIPSDGCNYQLSEWRSLKDIISSPHIHEVCAAHYTHDIVRVFTICVSTWYNKRVILSTKSASYLVLSLVPRGIVINVLSVVLSLVNERLALTYITIWKYNFIYYVSIISIVIV